MPSLRGVDKFFTKRKRTFGGNEKDPKILCKLYRNRTTHMGCIKQFEIKVWDSESEILLRLAENVKPYSQKNAN